MNLAEIYRHAAKAMEEGETMFSCNAIDHVVGVNDSPEGEQYRKIFGFEPYTFPDPFVGAVGDAAAECKISAEHLRIMLLCMAAAVAENP